MILALTAAALFATAAPLQPADVAGLYLIGQMEMAGGLELGRDGRFRYALDYGAVSETAEGHWVIEGSTVRLTSDPMPKPPGFSLVHDRPAPTGELYVAVEDTGFSWSPLSALVTLDGSPDPVRVEADGDGRILLPSGKRATSIRLVVPVYGGGGDSVVLGDGRGHRLLFRFEPNDLGKALFRGEPLSMDGSSLIMTRYDTRIVFRRAKQ